MELKIKQLTLFCAKNIRDFWVSNYRRLFFYLLKLVIFIGVLLMVLPIIIDKTFDEKIVIIKDMISFLGEPLECIFNLPLLKLLS
ncbi:MAG: hypothetical protein WCX31_13185 [Salinivirgaceae bacterium]|jgi:hypothetical protein